MEKTLTIDGKNVILKSTAAVPKRYIAQFGRDFFKDILKMFPLAKMDLEKLEDDDETMQKILEVIDFDIFYDIMWTMAKTADKSIPEPIEWLDEFEVFPLEDVLKDVFPMIQTLITKNVETKKK